ncbi:unannotated protein [freshwater metagenome]|uniref:Unannotated protein n=1 Tax=freshwater metagenome TaxID=449393 RepID=A0A6J6YCZ6_9ZZZZ
MVRFGARADRERRRCLFAEADARCVDHAGSRLGGGAGGHATPSAHKVLADVDGGQRHRVHGEHGVKGGNAVGLGWRHVEAPADLGETALTHGADAVHEHVQCGEQEVSHGRRPVGAALLTRPALHESCRAEYGLECIDLFGRGVDVGEAEIHD